MDVPVGNDYLTAKMGTYLDPIGPPLLPVMNPDRFPMFLRTNFYVRATRAHRLRSAARQLVDRSAKAIKHGAR
jgi:hypothetical protein